MSGSGRPPGHLLKKAEAAPSRKTTYKLSGAQLSRVDPYWASSDGTLFAFVMSAGPSFPFVADGRTPGEIARFYFVVITPRLQ